MKIVVRKEELEVLKRMAVAVGADLSVFELFKTEGVNVVTENDNITVEVAPEFVCDIAPFTTRVANIAKEVWPKVAKHIHWNALQRILKVVLWFVSKLVMWSMDKINRLFEEDEELNALNNQLTRDLFDIEERWGTKILN